MARFGSAIRGVALLGSAASRCNSSVRRKVSRLVTCCRFSRVEMTSGWGGELGLAHLDHGHFMSVHRVSGTALQGISGIVRARNGDFWLNGIDGISRIPREEIARVNSDSAYPVRSDNYNYLDGVLGSATQIRPQPSAIETSDGLVWFSMTGGAVSIDATRLVRNSLPPPVTIWFSSCRLEAIRQSAARCRAPHQRH